MRSNTITGAKEMKQYYYRPLSYYDGFILKCAGHGAEDTLHKAFYQEYFDVRLESYSGAPYLPGVVILEGYRGDKIRLDNLACVDGFEKEEVL